jgi:hypothetical protein
MEAVDRLIQIARGRVRIQRAMQVACAALLAAASIVLVLSIIDRLPAASFISWWFVLSGLALLVLAVSMLAWSLERPADLAMAAMVDDRLELDDRLATALHMANRGDPVAKAVVEDAAQVASDPRTRERMQRLLRPAPPSGLWVAPVLLACALLVAFTGQADLFAASTEERADSLASVDVSVDQSEVTSIIESQPQLQEAMAEQLDALEAEQARLAEEQLTAEEQRLAELKQMTALDRSLDELIEGEQARSMDSLRSRLERMEQPEGDEAEALADALAKGDFAAAKEALESMQSAMDDGSMSEDQREALADELSEMSRQLNELASEQSALADAIEQAGLDPQLADSPKALEDAIKQAEQLTEQQREQLLDQIKAEQAAQQACEKMGEACDAMSKQCQQGKPGQQCGQQMSEQLSELEQAQEMLKQAKSAQQACQKQCRQLGSGLPSNSQSQCAGTMPGGGKPGELGGGGMQVAEGETDASLRQASGTAEDGPVISRTKTDGPLEVGASGRALSFEEIVTRSRDGFDDAFNENQLPRKYHELIKHYFGDSTEVTDAVEYDAARAEGDDGPTEPPAEEPTEPTEPPADEED